MVFSRRMDMVATLPPAPCRAKGVPPTGGGACSLPYSTDDKSNCAPNYPSYSRGGGEEPLPLGSATPPSFMRLFNQQLSKGGEVEGGGESLPLFLLAFRRSHPRFE